MANRDCHGDHFEAAGERYYRCMWNGAILPGLQDGSQCPNCERMIDGQDLGALPVEIKRVALTEDGHRFVLPNAEVEPLKVPGATDGK